jgi:hypothetical protein
VNQLNSSRPGTPAAFGLALSWVFAFVALTVTAGAARSPALFDPPASLSAAAAWIGGLLAVFIPLSLRGSRRIS